MASSKRLRIGIVDLGRLSTARAVERYVLLFAARMRARGLGFNTRVVGPAA
jgi:hypothetical protein